MASRGQGPCIDDADADNDDTDDDDEGDNDDGDDDDDGTRLRGLPWACRGQVHSVTTVTHFEASLERQHCLWEIKFAPACAAWPPPGLLCDDSYTL